MVSLILPVYREPYLNRTLDSLLENLTGKYEILVVVDGYALEEPIREDPRIKIISLPKNRGMRGAINAGLKEAKGEWIIKLDAHCIVCKGFDQIVNDCQKDWIVAPRRYSLNEETWKRDETLPERDYHYLCYPGTSNRSYGYSFQVQNWPRWGRGKLLIDNTMTIQGSCWIANREYFMKHVGFMDDRPETYGSFAQDQQEICLKYWLGGGQVKVNKKYWYAHLQKRESHYKSGVFSHRHKKDNMRVHGNEWGTDHWMNNKEPGMKHNFSWLLEKFWPLPSWPEDRKLWEYKK